MGSYLTQPEIKLVFPALQGRFLTFGPPGKSQDEILNLFILKKQSNKKIHSNSLPLK